MFASQRRYVVAGWNVRVLDWPGSERLPRGRRAPSSVLILQATLDLAGHVLMYHHLPRKYHTGYVGELPTLEAALKWRSHGSHETSESLYSSFVALGPSEEAAFRGRHVWADVGSGSGTSVGPHTRVKNFFYRATGGGSNCSTVTSASRSVEGRLGFLP